MEKDRKVFNDPIHGNIELHPLCMKIVDTPQFQRLRFIKQLGGAYFVYPGAAHNRFEHSIGVCHLAGRLVRALRKQEDAKIHLGEQEAVEITDVDELCVEVAGLCHDLGHGPFSHLFDKTIIPALRKDKKWKHEDGSVDMFRYMLKANDGQLEKEFEEEGRLKSVDVKFIEEMIVGPDETIKNTWTYKGRPKEKGFLYEIVSNKRNGIDVDKWDYFARDCHMLGIGNNFNHDRCIAFSRVVNVEGEKQICFRNKEAANLYDMFHTRYLLHTRAYQHKTNNIIEYMISEALIKANNFITFPGKNGEPRKMSEAIDDMEAYTLLNDCVIYTILGTTDKSLEESKHKNLEESKHKNLEESKHKNLEESKHKNLEESKHILLRVLRRDMYIFVGEKRFAHDTFEDENNVEEDMKSVANITEDQNIIVDLVRLNYGMKDKNPVDSVNFFSKDKPNEAGPIPREDVSLLLPTVFAEQLVRVYCKDPENYNNAKEKFEVWLKNTTKSAKKQETSR